MTGGSTVDNWSKVGEILEPAPGTLRHPAAIRQTGDLTLSVGSTRRPVRTSRSDAEASLETLERLNATSEIELLEGRGMCGRCCGCGLVIDREASPMAWVDCPRCDGTGRRR
jgi:hypothetical protein